jgi:hypothetical protein
MTLVVRMNPDNCLILLADILLSAPSDKTTTKVPTVGQFTADLSHCAETPAGLAQKISLFGEHMALAWAGNYQVASEFFTDYFNAHYPDDFNEHSFHELVERQPVSTWEQISVMGYLLEGEEFFRMSAGRVHFLPTSRFGEIAMMGMGTNAFNKMRGEIDFDSSEYSVGDVAGQAPPYMMHMGTALHMASSFMQRDLFTDPVKDQFGGGYELAGVFEKRLIKVPNVAFFFWFVGLDSEKSSSTLLAYPMYVFRNTYHNDILVITRLEYLNGTPGEYRRGVYVVPPIYRTLATNEWNSIQVPEFDAPVNCHSIMMYLHSNSDGITLDHVESIVQWPPSDKVNPWVTGTWRDKDFLHVTPEFHQCVHDLLKRVYHTDEMKFDIAKSLSLLVEKKT